MGMALVLNLFLYLSHMQLERVRKAWVPVCLLTGKKIVHLYSSPVLLVMRGTNTYIYIYIYLTFFCYFCLVFSPFYTEDRTQDLSTLYTEF